MTATTLLYNQYLRTITSPQSVQKPIETPISPPALVTASEPLLRKPSPLLALPFELRHQIYTHALSLHDNVLPKSPTNDHTPLFVGHISLSLLLVNRQIYHEVCLLPFEVNTFVFTTCWGSSVASARTFMNRLSDAQRAAMRSIEVVVAERGIVGGWSSGEGLENVFRLLNECKKVNVKILVKGDESVSGNGNVVLPSSPLTMRGERMGKGKAGWMEKAFESKERGEGVSLEFCLV